MKITYKKGEVLFQDENGESILAKTNSKEYAQKIINKFKKDLKNGILLKPFKSAYK